MSVNLLNICPWHLPQSEVYAKREWDSTISQYDEEQLGPLPSHGQLMPDCCILGLHVWDAE